ncbi:MAG: ribonuclease E/G, partial [Lachnospiraceae bacterium]|nr:ribonuclease E/G [Lachnospiraceae bacterium]
MNKRIVTKYRDGILTAVYENDRFTLFNWERPDRESLIGNIYVGRVNKVVHGIHAAFVDVGDGLSGYYSLTDNPVHLYLSEGKHDRLKEGDMILVQVERDPVKTKMMVLTGKLNLTGRYVALTCGYPGLSFSSKLKGGQYKELKDQVRDALSDFPTADYALIVRTNGKTVGPETIQKEAYALLERLEKIKKDALYRTAGCLMMTVPAGWLQDIR